MLYIIVRRGDFGQYDRLHQAFGERAPVVWDRRRTAGQSANGDAPDLRPIERRQPPPPSWAGLGFVVVDRPV
jgi:hypothetical protein